MIILNKKLIFFESLGPSKSFFFVWADANLRGNRGNHTDNTITYILQYGIFHLVRKIIK